MSKDIKKMLEEKLQINNQRHAKAVQSVHFLEGRDYVSISVDKIDPNPYQPRCFFPEDELEKLANSIKEIGLLEPILLRRVGDRYQIAAGERRWRAHKIIDRVSIEAIVTGISDSDMAVFALAENVDREDLSDYEIGLALRQIEGLFPTKKKLAESLGINREDMYRYFAFEELPALIRKDLDSNPRLLSRSAASDIKRLMVQHQDVLAFNDYLLDAWRLLQAGVLEQTKIVTYITQKLKTADGLGLGLGRVRATQPLVRQGSRVGLISWSGKYMTVKVDVGVLDQDKEQKLRVFLEDLVDAAILEV